MRSEEQIRADYQSLVVLLAIAISLKRDGAKPKSVFDPAKLQNLVERYFAVRPSEEAIKAAMIYGGEFQTWRVIGPDNETPHVEIIDHGIEIYIESWLHVENSHLYALESVGSEYLRELLKKSVDAARSDYEFNKSGGDDYKGHLLFDRMRETLAYMSGLEKYRKHGRSNFSRRSNPDPDWPKWGAIAAIVAIPVAVILWWFN